MAGHIELGIIHHIRLTVTDIDRSREFYTGLLGFDVAVAAPASDDPKSDPSYPVLWGGCVMAKGNYLLGLRPVAAKGDRFDEDRVGADVFWDLRSALPRPGQYPARDYLATLTFWQ